MEQWKRYQKILKTQSRRIIKNLLFSQIYPKK